MTVKSAASWSGTFVCKDATGALAAATVGPVGILYLNGTSNAASVTISGANPYKWTLTLPALSAGDRVDIYITATVGGIATAAIVASDNADTKLISGLNDIAATAIVSGGAITTSSGAVSTVTTLTNAPADSASITRLINALAPTTGSVNDAGASTTVFITTLASAVNDFYKGEAIVFTSGALAGQLGQIKSYNGSTKSVTLQSALTSAPANGVSFVVATVAASRKFADLLATAMGTDNKILLSGDAQTGVTIPTVTTLTNAPADSSGVTTLLGEVADIKTATTPPGMVLP